ncbi:hypothetical protein FB45DRAFT_1039804 [Roridomyces roridus]|uniref:Uncharacterized protein n=1 Tax=Roridomyces roridus TaxID=1738132 RepID=A0AAD7B2F2_9AGAR|nr:hypothetical protein FB45DRAFT_1039804 [Roridomyces roridus]
MPPIETPQSLPPGLIEVQNHPKRAVGDAGRTFIFYTKGLRESWEDEKNRGSSYHTPFELHPGDVIFSRSMEAGDDPSKDHLQCWVTPEVTPDKVFSMEKIFRRAAEFAAEAIAAARTAADSESASDDEDMPELQTPTPDSERGSDMELDPCLVVEHIASKLNRPGTFGAEMPFPHPHFVNAAHFDRDDARAFFFAPITEEADESESASGDEEIPELMGACFALACGHMIEELVDTRLSSHSPPPFLEVLNSCGHFGVLNRNPEAGNLWTSG